MREKPIDFMPTPELQDYVGNVSSGTRLELMTRYAVKPNGKWCIVSIEAVPMPGYDSEGNPTMDRMEKMETGQFSKSYMEHMGATGGKGESY